MPGASLGDVLRKRGSWDGRKSFAGNSCSPGLLVPSPASLHVSTLLAVLPIARRPCPAVVSSSPTMVVVGG